MAAYAVPITKAKRTIPVESKDFSDDIAAIIFAEGLKVMLNKGMSKIAVKDLDGDELKEAQEAALQQAKENLDALKEGTVKRRKASKEGREVTTEALRIARERVKAAYKAAGKKITGIKASVITEYAKEIIEDDPEIVELAKANVAKMKQRELGTVKVSDKLSAKIKEAEDAKPRVAPKRKAKEGANEATVIAGKAKGKGKGTQATAN